MAEDNLPDDFDVIVLGTGRICSKIMVYRQILTEKQSEKLLLCVTAVMGPLRRNFDEFSRRWGKGVLINFDLEFHIVVLVHQKA